MTDQNHLTSNTPEDDINAEDIETSPNAGTGSEKVLNSDLPGSAAPDDDYEDNFIEDPQGAVTPHSATPTGSTSRPAAPTTMPESAAPAASVPPAAAPPASAPPVSSAPAASVPAAGAPADDQNMESRLERLGGEPAPVITPEEFARLQKAGQVHIDERGRVRTARRSDASADAGVSLRKRRAWYGQRR